MAGGGKGGSQSTTVKIPEWLEAAAKGNLARADQVSQIGYVPYYGPDVAAMTPRQLDAMHNTNAAAGAFGLEASRPNAGMPQSQSFGGVYGYSSQPMYQQAVDKLKAVSPGQFNALARGFVDPRTGLTAVPQAPLSAPQSPAGPQMQDYGQRGVGAASTGQIGGGYTGLRDMINGGGPGAAGAAFQGGPISNALNNIGVQPRDGGGSGMGGGK